MNTNLSDSLSEREVEDNLSNWLPNFYKKDRNSNIDAEHRFRPQLYLLDRLTFRIQEKLRRIIKSNSNLDDAFSYSSQIPLHWQHLLNYLYRKKVIASPVPEFEPVFNDLPKIFLVRLTAVSDPALTDGVCWTQPNRHKYGRGASPDPEEAISKAVGEFLERYPLTIYKQKDLIYASVADLQKADRPHLNIFDLAGFADWQKERSPKMRFDKASNFYWAEGLELLTGRKSLIPAQLIFWNYKINPESKEPYLREANTNGTAGYFTREEAILASVYELVQRDAFLIHWLNRLAPPRVDPQTLKSQAARDLLAEARRRNFDIFLLNTTLDLKVPSAISVLINKSDVGPKLALGGGAGPNLESALERSLTEAIAVYQWVQLYSSTEKFNPPENYQPFIDPEINQHNRLRYWGNPDMFKNFKWLISGPTQSLDAAQSDFPLFFKTPKAELNYALDIFRKRGKGYEVYIYKASHQILNALGFHSVHAIIPALMPLYLWEANAAVGAARLKDALKLMGYETPAELNPWPHPFP